MNTVAYLFPLTDLGNCTTSIPILLKGLLTGMGMSGGQTLHPACLVAHVIQARHYQQMSVLMPGHQ